MCGARTLEESPFLPKVAGILSSPKLRIPALVLAPAPHVALPPQVPPASGGAQPVPASPTAPPSPAGPPPSRLLRVSLRAFPDVGLTLLAAHPAAQDITRRRARRARSCICRRLIGCGSATGSASAVVAPFLPLALELASSFAVGAVPRPWPRARARVGSPCFGGPLTTPSIGRTGVPTPVAIGLRGILSNTLARLVRFAPFAGQI